MHALYRIIVRLSAIVLLATFGHAALAEVDDLKYSINPLRLSYINGSVSFMRNGAEDWVEARINTPLVVGDALYTGSNAVFELQGEGRAFIRADDDTEVTLVNQTPDFLQLKVTAGLLSLDLRTLPASGYTIEVDTPNAVFTIDHTGYYRVEVDGDVHFITRRGGRAVMTPAGGEAMNILPSEEVVVSEGGDRARAATYVAPEPDSWDRWNDDRTNDLVEAYSERYMPSGVAGARDLDHYGSWRVSDEYGQVWVPDGMASDWVPYSSGRWVWDPYYQWTWIDDNPWGWAPFHYGRWVYLGGYWAWAPGPVVLRRPVYAPALVAFYGVGSHVSVSVGLGGGSVSWIALGWGEPLIPWWGRSGFIGRPWWGGWHGPCVVNRVVVRPTAVVNITNITYANSRVPNAFIATTQERFGRDHMREASFRLRGQERDMDHVRGALPVKPNRASLVADAPRSISPPEQVISRPVVATRRPQESRLPWRTETSAPVTAGQRIVPAPKTVDTRLRRPEPGTETGAERARPPLPSRYEDWRRQARPVSPPAAERTESRSVRAAPVETVNPMRGRELGQPEAPQMPRAAEPQRQSPRGEESPRQPMRSIQPEMAPQPRVGREVAAPAPNPAPARIAPERQPSLPRVESVPQPARVVPTERAAPMRGERQVAPPVMAPIQGEPQSRRIENAPREGRQDLPGVPANRTYRGNQERSEREHQQR